MYNARRQFKGPTSRYYLLVYNLVKEYSTPPNPKPWNKLHILIFVSKPISKIPVLCTPLASDHGAIHSGRIDPLCGYHSNFPDRFCYLCFCSCFLISTYRWPKDECILTTYCRQTWTQIHLFLDLQKPHFNSFS